MTSIMLVIATALANALAGELFGWFPWLARRVIRRAVRRLPLAYQRRYEEEWLGELDALPAKGISSLIFSLHVLWSTSQLCGSLRETATSSPATWQLAVKRGLDAASCLISLVCLAPLFLVIAISVRLCSRGPVIARDPCLDGDGQLFCVLRFRTREMMDAVAQGGASSNLAPFTRVGRFLHKASLDELPQLINILRGEMSLVGPRPQSLGASGIELQDKEITQPMKPGMTGWSQVRLQRQVSVSRALDDDYYAKNWALRLDLKILWMTLLASLGSRASTQ